MFNNFLTRAMNVSNAAEVENAPRNLLKRHYNKEYNNLIKIPTMREKVSKSLAIAAFAFIVIVAGARKRGNIIIADFENDSYGNWKAEGKAFGSGPAKRIPDAHFGLNVLGYELSYNDLLGELITLLKAPANVTNYVKPDTENFKIEAIVDKNILEVFVNDGEMYYAMPFDGPKTDCSVYKGPGRRSEDDIE